MATLPMPGAPKPAMAQPSAYDPIRKRLEQRFTAQAQQGQDAIQRKLASLGNLNSGAAMKIRQQVDNDVAQQREEAIGQVDSQEAQMLGQQNFQSSEAQKMRDFQGGQFDKTFGLDQTTKLGQLDLARQEMLMKGNEQDFNMSTELKNQGYGIDLNKILPDHMAYKLYGMSGAEFAAKEQARLRGEKYEAEQRQGSNAEALKNAMNRSLRGF